MDKLIAITIIILVWTFAVGPAAIYYDEPDYIVACFKSLLWAAMVFFGLVGGIALGWCFMV
jgi:hypothetical protein